MSEAVRRAACVALTHRMQEGPGCLHAAAVADWCFQSGDPSTWCLPCLVGVALYGWLDARVRAGRAS